jgi:phosphoribosylglycinamide formyltransferase 1
MKARVAVMASGNGSNFQAITEASKTNRLSAEIVGLICNKKSALALERAQALGVPSVVILRSQFLNLEAWNLAMSEQLEKWRADWVVLAGFTGLVGRHLLEKFPNRFINSHPSLLPKFGGKGMYGDHVHRAVVAAKETTSGISVHLLNEHFDEGPVLAQKPVPVLPGDTAETLAERIKTEERKFFPQVLEDLLTGRIKSR